MFHAVPPQAEALIRLKDVSKTYQMGEVTVHALKDATLEIQSGELLVIVGPSGSGKSTALNVIGGIDLPSAGQIWYRDQELTKASNRELTRYRREAIGFVFQFYNLVPTLTARENVMAATQISEDPIDAGEVLDMVGLKDRSDFFPSQLSGGEQQRVSIARALAKNPELLLCDEPTGALDYETGIKVLQLLVDLKQRLGKTILIITHNMAIAEIGDRVVHMRSGEITNIVTNEQPLSPKELSW